MRRQSSEWAFWDALSRSRTNARVFCETFIIANDWFSRTALNYKYAMLSYIDYYARDLLLNDIG